MQKGNRIKSLKNFGLLLVGLFFLSLTSCRKCPLCEPPPLYVPMRIVDKNSNKDLLYSKRYSLDSLQIYYLENNTKYGLKIHTTTDTTNEKVYFSSDEWVYKSIKGTKKYYLYLNYQDIDTVIFDAVEIGGECCSNEKLNKFEINGSELTNDLFGYGRIYKK